MLSSRRQFLQTATTASAAAQSRRPPNVLVILTDDQGYGDFSCHGNPVLKTPAMDRLHSESVRFTHFHVAPMCTPTRGELMSGQDALRNGATSVTAGRALLRREIPTMADVFSANNYSTGIFGKWHLGDCYPYRPMERGFQEAVYHLGWGLQSAPEFTNDYFNGRYRHNGAVKQWEGYCTDFWFNQAMRWMDERSRKREPFFCYLPTNAPHGPLWVDEKYAAPYRQPGVPAQFFGMIANLNENLTRLDEFLAQRGLRDNTIVLFMTDNGATAGFNTFNAGMRGRKTQIYEGGHRVPCFLRWPGGGLRASGDIPTPTQIQDILPTFIDLCGLKKPAPARFDGRSLAGLLRGALNFPDRMLVVQYGQIPKKWEACVIWNQWRLVNGTELYDLASDPAQASDAAAKNPSVLGRMREHYDRWWAGVEQRLTDFAPISIGAPQENPVSLTCSDWQDIYCDNTGNVMNAAGGARGGPWSVVVERDGEYEITLSRWPAELNLPLNAPCPEQKKHVATVPGGKALPVAAVQLRIAGQSAETKTAPAGASASFRVKLAGKQKTNLQAWFQDAAGNDLAGAFYAAVRRL